MNPSDELVLLIQSIVDKKVKAATLNIKNITSAGDLALTSMGDIRINTAGTHKAYYNGMEIGTTSGTITGSGTTNYIPKFTGATAIGDSALIDDGTDLGSAVNIILKSAKQLKLNNISNTLVGKVFGTYATVEGVTYNGLQLQPQNMVGTSAGNIYIGDYEAAPSGVGIKVMNSRLDIVAVSGATIYLGVGTTQIGSLSSTQFDFLKPLAMNSQKITGLAAGTVAGDALRYEQLVGVYLPLAGGTMAGAIAHGAYDTYFTDGYGIDFRNDDIHKLYYHSGNNALRHSSYFSNEFYTTLNSKIVGYFGDIGSGGASDLRLVLKDDGQTAANNVSIKNDAGNMELHVPTGKVIKIIVG